MSKSNWAVGECYRTNANQDPRKRNIHDPDNQYVWADEVRDELLYSYITWAGRALFGVGFLTGIYMLVFLGLSF